MRKLIGVVGVLCLGVVSCGISEGEACKLAKEYVRGHTRYFVPAKDEKCSGFVSKSDIGRAAVKVPTRSTGFSAVGATTVPGKPGEVTCQLQRTDQGWRVTSCGNI